jgi:hypothetical protein
MSVMMKCGHAANATMDGGRPVCAICFMATLDDAATIVAETPDLADRRAICSYNHSGSVPSSTDLAFFEHRPNESTDKYYCGCWGWD